jgi:hypothetical protein
VVVNTADFRASLSGAAPAPSLAPPLAALWWAAKGDLGNAGYWYRQAGKPVAKDSLEAEWERIVSALSA